MNDLRICTVDNQKQFDYLLLSIEKMAKLMDSEPMNFVLPRLKAAL